MIESESALSTSKWPSIAVVILNWNGKYFLQKYLPSVIKYSTDVSEIIVADNASNDDSISFLKENFPSIKIIKNETNEGFANGYNLALKQVVADYFVLLNSDVEVTQNWIEPIINLMESDTLIAACQPKILDEKNKSFFEYAGACGGFIDKNGYPFARGRIFETIEKDEGQYDTALPCFWASGAAMFVRADVYKKLGGLDGYFFAHQEEIDLCWRMQLEGYKVYVQPKSVVYHVGGGTLPSGNKSKVFLNFRNNLIMLYKNTPTNSLIFLLPKRFLLDAIAAHKGLLEGNIGYFFAIAKAHFYFIKWILLYKKKFTKTKINIRKLSGVYYRSLLWHYFIKNEKKFSQIIKHQ